MSEDKDKNPLLQVENLMVRFGRKNHQVTAVQKICLEIDAGETYGLVGGSGSGKSTIGKAIIGLNPVAEGRVVFDGVELTGEISEEERRKTLGKIQMIFQDPMSSLNPSKKVRDIVAAGLDARGDRIGREERAKKVGDYLEKVGLARENADRYPAQFSGGQRQRVGIARALILEPKLIIADESIAALDASVQAQVVNLLRKIQAETGTSFLFISHDLSMVRFLSQKIGVLHMGYMLETGTTEEIFSNPIHPYTKSLLAAIPTPNPVVQSRRGTRYDYGASGLIYENGTWHNVNPKGTHRVWCDEESWVNWSFVEDNSASGGNKAAW